MTQREGGSNVRRAVGFALTAVVVACGTLTGGGDDVVAPPPAGSDASADGATEAGPATCSPPPSYDLHGCLCETANVVAPCFQGVPGDASACNIQGSQTCAPAADGQLRWSTCTGGSRPTAEVCHNDVDDDCNGVVDDNCPCTSSVDLCHVDQDAGAPQLTPDGYTFFTIPRDLHKNQEFALYVVTKNKTLTAPGIMKNPGGLCYGGGAIKPCASVGADCGGWKVLYFAPMKESDAAITFDLFEPRDTGGCGPNKVATSQTFNLAP